MCLYLSGVLELPVSPVELFRGEGLGAVGAAHLLHGAVQGQRVLLQVPLCPANISVVDEFHLDTDPDPGITMGGWIRN